MNKSVEELAKLLHESTRGGVLHFREWDQLDDGIYAIKKVFIAQAQALTETYAMLPLDNTRACSGCRTLTNALNDMDESRRQLIRHREVLAALVGATEHEELRRMKAIIEALAPDDEKDNILAAINTLMQPILNATPAVAGGAL